MARVILLFNNELSFGAMVRITYHSTMNCNLEQRLEQFSYSKLSCYLKQRLCLHRYSFDIFSYSGPSGILDSDGKQNTD